MDTAAFDFFLPESLIAQFPAAERHLSRLLAVDRTSRTVAHHPNFSAIVAHFRPGDLLVLNNSKVLPARLRGKKLPSGGAIEILLLREVSRNEWWAMLRPGKRVRPGTRLIFSGAGSKEEVEAVVTDKNDEGHCCLGFSCGLDLKQLLGELGEVPLPPYLSRPAEEMDRVRYQTVYAHAEGSVAAPTAGLHFTEDLLDEVKAAGVEVHFVTLHIGLGTFAPVKAASISEHVMHEEHFELSAATADAVNAARVDGRRVVAVGTTSVRVLESVAASNEGRLVKTTGSTRIFIYPPYSFRVVDALLTNFHLPKSTLLMLVSAFAAPGETSGREWMLSVYEEAIRAGYRFFSYGDAMLIE